MLVPPALRPGARIRLVAPSGPFDRTLVLRGVAWLSQRYRVELDWAAFARSGFLAGSDARRSGELRDALADPNLAAIVAARGGYGASRIAHALDFSVLRSHPKWIVGFSDVTVLHVEAARHGLASLHAHNAAGLGRGDEQARTAWLDALERPLQVRTHDALETWVSGAATGPLFGGNLTLLTTCAAAGRLQPPPSAVWFLEDVGESPYRIDRMLTALRIGGHFDGATAIVLGEFTDCPAGPSGVSVQSVLRERLSDLGVPVLYGVRAGHGRHNVPLHLGLTAQVARDRLTLGA